jgi:hypothetical protein
MDGASAGVVELVGNAREVGIDAGELEIVIDLMEQVADGGRVAIAIADEAAESWGQLLLDRFLEDWAAHDGAWGVEAEEVESSGFAGCGSGDDTFTKVSSTLHGGLHELKEFDGESSAEKIVLLSVEGALNLLLCGGEVGGGLETGERGEALADVMDEATMHLSRKPLPSGDKGRWILMVAGAEFVVDDAGKSIAKLGEAAGAGQLGDGLAEFAAGSLGGGHLHELFFGGARCRWLWREFPFPGSRFGPLFKSRIAGRDRGGLVTGSCHVCAGMGNRP